MKYTKKVQRGFTLLELVVVIAVIGTLIVVALPRLLTTSSDARVAALGGVAASLSAASALNYSKRTAVKDVNNIINFQVADCADVSKTLQGGTIPSGYSITALAITTTDSTAITCTLSNTAAPLITTTFTAYGVN